MPTREELQRFATKIDGEAEPHLVPFWLSRDDHALRDALRLFRAIVKRTGSIRTTTGLSDLLE
jgi:hypothetical protein